MGTPNKVFWENPRLYLLASELNASESQKLRSINNSNRDNDSGALQPSPLNVFGGPVEFGGEKC